MKTIALLEQLRHAVSNINRSHVTPRARLQALEKIVSALDHQLEDKKGEFRILLTQLRNEAQSLIEGLVSQDADEDDVTNFVRSIINAYKSAIALEKEERLKQPKTPTPEDDSGIDLQKYDQENKAVIQKYSGFGKHIPDRLIGNSTVVRAPVVAVTKPFFNLDKLKAVGIANDHISYYPVLLNQAVLGIKPSWVTNTSEFKNNPLTAAEYLLDLLRTETKKRWEIMSSKKIMRQHVIWFWIADDRMNNLIRKGTSTGNIQVLSWGFAFND